MSQKPFQSIDKYISAILYFLLMSAFCTFYYAATDVASAVLKYDYAKNVWGYNAAGTLIISLVILISISLYAEARIKNKHSILTEDTPRKFLLTITSIIFVFTFIFTSYKTLDQFLHGEYRIYFYINQIIKLLISSIILIYSFKALKRDNPNRPLLMIVLNIAITIIGMGLFATNLHFSPSLKELRMKQEDEEKKNQLKECTKVIARFAKSHKKLPQSLEAVAIHTGKPKALQDPITNENFLYKLKNPQSAEVCAQFHSPFPLEHENLIVNPSNPHERCTYIKENKSGGYETTGHYDY